MKRQSERKVNMISDDYKYLYGKLNIEKIPSHIKGKIMTGENLKEDEEREILSIIEEERQNKNNEHIKNFLNEKTVQPQDCIFGYGVCCYPIEECSNCPNREREVK